MLLQLSWDSEFDSGLKISGSDCQRLAGPTELRRISCDLLIDLENHRVESLHRLFGDPNLWMHLLQNSIDIGLDSILLSLDGVLLLGSVFGDSSFGCCFGLGLLGGWHS